MGCCIVSHDVSVDLNQGKAVFLSHQVVVTHACGPRFQRPFAQGTTMPSVRLGQCGAGSV